MKKSPENRGFSVKLLDRGVGKVYLNVSNDISSIPNPYQIANTAKCCGFTHVWLLCPLIHRKSRINRARNNKNTPITVAGLGIAVIVQADIKRWSDWFHDTKHLIASEGRDKTNSKSMEFKRAL